MLTEVKLKSLKPRDRLYRVADAGGLCVEVTPSGSKLWRYRYRHAGKPTMVSFGAWPEVSLARARQLHADARSLRRDGSNPSAERQAAKVRALASAANTFKALWDEWYGKASGAMAEATKEKTGFQFDLMPDWFTAKPIREITPGDILAVLRPLEDRGVIESAHRLKQRISQVFRYSVATGKADRDPTGDLRGALAPIVSKNRAAITDPKAMGDLLRALDSYTGLPTTRAALRISPLLFARPFNLRAMEWSELDLDAAEWRIPAAKMKMRDAHTVPLSTQAVDILREVLAWGSRSQYVFPGARNSRVPMSNATINSALRYLGFDKDTMTGHGFRAMASTRLNELGWNTDVIERQLAHVERNKVRAAYNRAQYLAERKLMMQAWADYLDGLRTAPEKVVPIRKAKTH